MRHGPFFGPGPGHLWWVGGLFTLLVTVAIVVGVILVVRELRHRHPGSMLPPGPPPPPVSPAIHELDMRYARGEIDRAEYLQRRADLSGGQGPLPPGAASPP